MKILVALSFLVYQILVVKSDSMYIFNVSLVETCDGRPIHEGKSFNFHGLKFEYKLSNLTEIPILSLKVTFKTEVKSPWPAKVTNELNFNGTWAQLNEPTKIHDLCVAFLDQETIAKNIVGATQCPIKNGVSFYLFHI